MTLNGMTARRSRPNDMAWAINAVMTDPAGWSTLANYTAGFKEVKALDPKTLQITLDKPIGNMEYRVSFLYAISAQGLWRNSRRPKICRTLPMTS